MADGVVTCFKAVWYIVWFLGIIVFAQHNLLLRQHQWNTKSHQEWHHQIDESYFKCLPVKYWSLLEVKHASLKPHHSIKQEYWLQCPCTLQHKSSNHLVVNDHLFHTRHDYIYISAYHPILTIPPICQNCIETARQNLSSISSFSSIIYVPPHYNST